jgi:hypothetical protein
MSAIYRERISDGRIEAVCMYVHDWLFTKLTGADGEPATIPMKAAQ